MRLARTTASRTIASTCAPMITLFRTAGPIISLMYTTLTARYPANPSVSAIERTTSAG